MPIVWTRHRAISQPLCLTIHGKFGCLWLIAAVWYAPAIWDFLVRAWLCTSQCARSTAPMEAELCFGACCKMVPCSRLSLTFSAKLVMAGSPSVLKRP